MNSEDYMLEYFDEECYDFGHKATVEDYDYSYDWPEPIDDYDRYADAYEGYYDDRW